MSGRSGIEIDSNDLTVIGVSHYNFPAGEDIDFSLRVTH
jgi:hypothetical protein